ncbi:DNA invertase Pin-like site-specific DNA recombinase [Streptosporangium brasiliense]|uniref:DNA invertase Pin-like site-specific DNA recombinase n=1 Tax=Streptosporangium brasiliense TaxID=47480 RepID=A0ABT9RG12_9ACTN|nr:recombinase family protein [Streptosporangium brasiliense]MDP9868224.1 DNA invertase Pin-like site-specific DNA recombinase [Streptosporangium brasiliense]
MARHGSFRRAQRKVRAGLSPCLWKALDYLREGDTLVVPSLDRLGRSLQDLIAIVAGLRNATSGSGR